MILEMRVRSKMLGNHSCVVVHLILLGDHWVHLVLVPMVVHVDSGRRMAVIPIRMVWMAVSAIVPRMVVVM